MSGLKSGQRVAGSSKVEGGASGIASRPGMLDGDEQRLVIGREARPAQFGADRNAIEMLRRAAQRPFSLDAPQSVSPAGVLLALPSVATHIRPWLSNARLSGMPNQPLLRCFRSKTRRRPQRRRVAALEQDTQRILFRRMIAVRRHHLDDDGRSDCRRAGWWRDLLRRAAVVVGQNDIDFLRYRVGLDVFWPVHLGRAEEIAGAARSIRISA